MKKLITSLFLAVASLGFSQENISYQKPSAEILQLADFSRPPSVSMDSKRETLVFSYRPTYKTLEELNKEDIKLAGLRIDPITNISSTVTYLNNIKLKRKGDKTEVQVSALPQNARITNLSFSPNEKTLAFTNTTSKGVELWIIDIATAHSKKISDDNLNANLGSPYSWFRNSQALLVNLLPKNRPALLNSKEDLPTGPTVSESSGKVSQNRTYQDLLKTPLDEKNFEILATSELVKIDLNGQQIPFLPANLYTNTSFSPDGELVMISTLHRPFSYIVPYNRFPSKSTVYTKDGQLVKEVNSLPLNEIQPKGFSSTRTGKRIMAWRSDMPATLYYVEALDGGDQANPVEFRDEVFTWEAPFNTTPQSLIKTKDRFAGISWGDAENAFLHERWYDTRNIKTHWFNPKTKTSKLLEDRNYQDVYSDPGDFQTYKNQYGRNVVEVKDGKVLLIGDGFTKEGQFPFIDELDLKTLKKNRIYTAKSTQRKEDIVDIIDAKKGNILILDQSSTDYPNYYIKNIKNNKKTALSNFENPFSGLKGVHKEVITYKRNDGVTLTGNLYLPAGYDRKTKKEKLPLLIWAYPAEFKDKATAGMSTKNENTFTFPSYGSFIYWVTKGYAVLDDASFPIIGEGNAEPNDTFVPQLVADAQAAIDAVDQLGYIDRKKVAVGGHSYGAFMTANLLTHSDLFACGIARSGAYNRTLTPFGFQNEQRNYWDAPQVYNTMSPFMNAHKMKTPILLIHGEADNNMGTFTMQTERYFQALKNLGAPVRMVLLPKESHGYAAKENIFHTLYEQDIFLEKCLKK
ncbi:S9 family peptidase [Elizabethkingia sp. JS20170427COW]|uniref:alpha/beta hydrolase family protein n=1 Tax=Elizabethkingia sp. JS20170427COW TaxID=2583851 RepID=UPI00110FFDFA|nr:prolyl oligopeptidase family serine peptidase [Elizabethkingia sp. JS20170427COW]QCX52277.1 S9 family peptidase [Elizabethkingia sp. JS20170427COW]